MHPIPTALRTKMAADTFYSKCCYKQCGRPAQWNHVWQYANKQIQEAWAILPACQHHHFQATPHNNAYKSEVRDYFEWYSLTLADYGDLARYPKANWPQRINYLKGQAKKYDWTK